jgi:sugar/nucleoside kinase (ribokinase family)
MSAKNELLCFGNAIVDIFAAVDPAWLDSHGIREPVQHIPREEAQRLWEELDTDAQGNSSAHANVILSSGGAAANVAKIAAMLNIGAAFVGCVGIAPQDLPQGGMSQRNGDDMAVIFEKDLRDSGVVPILGAGQQKTGLFFSFDCKGKTRIAASPGAALELTAADVREELFDGAEAVMLDGYLLDRRPLVQRILQLASQRGIPIALDAGSVFQIRERTEEILHYSRNYPLIVFMNADESIVFYNKIKKSKDNIEAATEREKEALILREICPVLKYITEGEIFPIIVIKLGGKGVAVLAGGNIYREETFTIIPRNTVGAGDAFCAAFLSAWIRGKSIRECASLGNKVARKILEVPGTSIKSRKLKPFARMLR